MATFKIVARTNTEYIRTDLTIHRSGINKKKEITDHFVMAQCATKIRDYVLKLNAINIENWNVKDIKEYLSQKKRRNFIY